MLYIELVAVINAEAGGSKHATVYDREFPILLVVYLLGSYKNRGTGKQDTLSRLPLMGKTAEELLELVEMVDILMKL